MLINGKAFEGTFDYEYTDGQLKLYTGASNVSCITRFRPASFPDAQIVYKLLHALNHYRLCCFLAGTFALFLAGRLDFYDGLAIFVPWLTSKSHLYCVGFFKDLIRLLSLSSSTVGSRSL